MIGMTFSILYFINDYIVHYAFLLDQLHLHTVLAAPVEELNSISERQKSHKTHKLFVEVAFGRVYAAVAAKGHQHWSGFSQVFGRHLDCSFRSHDFCGGFVVEGIGLGIVTHELCTCPSAYHST